MKNEQGFTLIELLAAMLLSTLVLVGIISLATNMIRYQFDSMKRGEVSGLNLVALSNMHRQIERATYLQAPTTAGGNEIRACEGYSSIWSGPLTPGQMSGMSQRGFVYCVDESPACPSGSPVANCPTLYHYDFPGVCPPPAVGTCGAVVSGVTPSVVIYRNFFKGDTQTNYFWRNNVVGGVEVNYIVGLSTSSANRPNPIAYKVRTRISMAKSYLTSVD